MKILSQGQIGGKIEELLDFYTKLYEVKRDYYRIALKNSSFICIEQKNGKIIGACRILTDMTKHAHIVDFIIDPTFRGQGIGKELIAFAGAECEKFGAKYIGLTCITELTDFYRKAGFGPVKGVEYMRYQLQD